MKHLFAFFIASWASIKAIVGTKLLALAYPVSSAGGSFTGDAQAECLVNAIDLPHQISVNGAIDPTTPGRYALTKATALALTLAAPTSGTADGLQLQFISGNAAQHVITATGLFQDGAGHVNTATWPANAGGVLELTAFQGKWIVSSNNNVVMA